MWKVYFGFLLALALVGGSILAWHALVEQQAAERAVLYTKSEGEPPNRYSEIGAFGDSFAPLSGAFSALALIAALVSVTIQSRELALQREELKLQREEAKEATANLRAQADAQAEANRLSALATQLACIKQLDELDAKGVELVRRNTAPLRQTDAAFANAGLNNSWITWQQLAHEINDGQDWQPPFDKDPELRMAARDRHDVNKIRRALETAPGSTKGS